METPCGPCGQRCLATLIDYYAEHEPDRPWVSIPINENELETGFQDITYKQFSAAISRAAWWLEKTLGVSNGAFETFAYSGDKDIRFPILAVAAVKVGRKVLLPSPFTTKEAHLHLLKSTESRAYLYSASMQSTIGEILQGLPDIRSVCVPEVKAWLDGEPPAPYPYKKTWEEAADNPWIIFHTSGTTGLPKPIVHTNRTMVYVDAAKTMPDAYEETTATHYSNGRWYSPVPSLHIIGMTMILQFTAFLGSVFVYGPTKGIPTPKTIAQVLTYGNVDGAILPPSLIDELTKAPEQLECLRQLKYVQWAGAPLSKPTGDLIAKDVKLMPCIGTTESGSWFPKVRNDGEWQYYTFREYGGIEFDQKTEDLYEVVFRKRPELERWQQIFHVFPQLDEFPTKDLFSKHPTKENLWEYVGRLDDMVNFSNGQSIRASALEAIINVNPNVRSSLVGGEHRHRPCLLLEMFDQGSAQPMQERIDQVWPTIEKANEHCLDDMRLIKQLTMFADPMKPFPRTTKGTLARREVFKVYEKEIDALYSRAI